MRTFLRASALSVCILLLAAAPNAFAVNKDIIALQAQVQQMQDMMMSMQQSNDERYATMHNLMQQTSESVGKVASQVEAMQKAAQDQQGAQGNSLQQLSGQMQSMNDSLDELRARLDKLEKRSIRSHHSSPLLAAGQPMGAGQAMAANGQPGGDQPQGASDQPPAPQAPPLDQLYQSAASDYNAAKYNLSSQEFADVIKFYPQSPQAANAQFYMGEIDYRAGNYKSAIDNYSAVLSQYRRQLQGSHSAVAQGGIRAGPGSARSRHSRFARAHSALSANAGSDAGAQ